MRLALPFLDCEFLFISLFMSYSIYHGTLCIESLQQYLLIGIQSLCQSVVCWQGIVEVSKKRSNGVRISIQHWWFSAKNSALELCNLSIVAWTLKVYFLHLWNEIVMFDTISAKLLEQYQCSGWAYVHTLPQIINEYLLANAKQNLTRQYNPLVLQKLPKPV